MKRYIFSILASIVIYFLILYFLDIEQLLDSFKMFSISSIIMSLIFSFMAMFFEYLKYTYYLYELGLKIPKKKNVMIFLSGYALGFLPARSGELMRSVILKKNKIPYSKSLPIYFAMNMTLLIVCFIVGLPYILQYLDMPYLFIAGLIILLINLRYNGLVLYIIRLIPFKPFRNLEAAVKNSSILFRARTLAASIAFTAVSTIFIFLAFWVLSVSMDFPLIIGFSAYNLTLIFGALSMLPGGLGATEAGFIFLMSSLMHAPQAAALVIIMRLVSVWVPMIVGLMTISSCYSSPSQQ